MARSLARPNAIVLVAACVFLFVLVRRFTADAGHSHAHSHAHPHMEIGESMVPRYQEVLDIDMH